MRIQYTIPGIDYAGPAETRELPRVESEALRPPEISWRNVLGLQHPQPGDLVLSPPPRPAALTYADADETRRQWTSLMRRHTEGPAGSPQEARMIQALDWLREQETDLQARILAEPKE